MNKVAFWLFDLYALSLKILCLKTSPFSAVFLGDSALNFFHFCLWNKNFLACIHFFFTQTFFVVSRVDFSCSRARSSEVGYVRLGNNS